MKRRGTCVGVALIALLMCAPSAFAQDDPAEQSPFGGQPVPMLRPASSPDQRIGSVSAQDAVDIATADSTISEELRESPQASARALVRQGRWQIEYRQNGELVAYAIVD